MLHFAFGEILKTWSLRSNSVTRQVSFNRTKIGENAKIQKFKCDILSNFQTICLGEKAMEVNQASNAEITGGKGATGGIQLAEEAVLFESLMENIGLAPPSSTITQATTSSNAASTSSISVGPPSASDGPHPISTETITLHYPIDSSLNPSTLFADNDLDESIREEHLICPHRAVEVLSPVKLNEQAKDQVIESLLFLVQSIC